MQEVFESAKRELYVSSFGRQNNDLAGSCDEIHCKYPELGSGNYWISAGILTIFE